MDTLVLAAVGLVVGYLFGSFPTGYFAGRLYGIDVRRHGSGRTGGTNVLRTAGMRAFLITIAGDISKGFIPVLLLRWLLPAGDVAPALAVLGVLLGHNWSFIIYLLSRNRPRTEPPPEGAYDAVRELFARAKGGAGVATTAAAALVLFAPPVLLVAPIGLLVVYIWRYASLASITVAALFPFFMAYFVWTGAAPPLYLGVSIASALVILYVHIPNIKRLREGTERKFGQRVGREPKPRSAAKGKRA